MKIFVKLFFLMALMNVACDEPPENVEDNPIKDWFNEGAANCDISKNLHFCSQWKYLSEQQFEEIIMDGVAKLDPPLKDGESIFDLGVGVGAPFQVLLKHMPNLFIGGSDLANNAIDVAKKVFPKSADWFFHHDMTKKHGQIQDNYFDHVVSFGALGMYLTKENMIVAIKEAARMTKPGGSLLFTNFIEPTGQKVGSIVDKVEKSFWATELPKLNLENIQVHDMKHQGDRYQISCTKKR